VTKQGLSAIVSTEGNNSCHVILRGSTSGPNYEEKHVNACNESLRAAGLREGVMIDCSHGNSRKVFSRQVEVADNIAHQLASTESGKNIFGVMLESHLVEGRQDIPAEGPAKLRYGQSITDACIGWETTVKVLDRLREGVRARRARLRKRA
jgi:3-deoxy-7-phosphoheptulonate synthase